jgi:pyridoxal phosphate-dependent aminotransferase EpsN
MGGDELGLVQEAFATNWIAPLGPHVDAFEREFSALTGSAHAAALSSGTAALHLAMRWLKLQPGDEVLCSSLTFSATVNPVLYERATPVFVDSDATSWNMDPTLLAEAIADRLKCGRKPKAVILVHLYGQSADLDPIAAICAEHEIPLIEDAAEALGAVYHGKRTAEGGGQASALGHQTSDVSGRSSGIAPGSVGLCGIFSFNGNKIITTSSGGMLVSNDKALVEKARFWATQARDPAPHYEHSELGFNYRMSNVLAAIGRGQLRVLADRVNARRRNCAFYEAAFRDLPGVVFMPEAEFGRCTRWLTCLTVDPKIAGLDREKLRLALAEENIEARPVWKPMHLQPIFKDTRCYGGAVSERLFADGLCLPSGSNLSESDLQRVVEVVRREFARR